jgi:hypothetical protein
LSSADCFDEGLVVAFYLISIVNGVVSSRFVEVIDAAGFTIAVIGVLYAVLLAFIAIATWKSFSRASDIVESESDFAGGIYLDIQGLPLGKGQPIPDAVAHYVNVVINDEWPIRRAGKIPDQGGNRVAICARSCL